MLFLINSIRDLKFMLFYHCKLHSLSSFVIYILGLSGKHWCREPVLKGAKRAAQVVRIYHHFMIKEIQSTGNGSRED
jgi:hypothetical protein